MVKGPGYLATEPGVGDECQQCVARPAPVIGRRVTPGKPFDECPSCGARVATGPFSEWDTMPASLKFNNIVNGLRWALLIGLLSGSVYTLWAMIIGDGASRLSVAIAFSLGFVVSGSWRGVWLVEAIQRSRRRMSDPMYTARLVKFELERLGAQGASVDPVVSADESGRVNAH